MSGTSVAESKLKLIAHCEASLTCLPGSALPIEESHDRDEGTRVELIGHDTACYVL